MTRRSVALAVLIALVMLATGGTAVALLARHEPGFYRSAEVPEGEGRVRLSGEFASEFTNRVLNGILNEQPWRATFAHEQINSYFEEDFLKKHSTKSPLPEGVSEPRLVFEPGLIRLGFRYGTGRWSTVVNIEMRPWLASSEPNTLVLEIVSLYAGGMPISAHSILERVAEAAKNRDVDVSWYRYRNHPVILIRFQANRSQPTFQLTQFETDHGRLTLAGRSVSAVPR